VLGAVKSTVGHLLTGAGAAALAKVLFALRERTLPPTANFERAAPGLGMERSPFRVLREAEAWAAPAGRGRRAAVSGFGFGGVNAHLLIEEDGPSLRGESAKRQARGGGVAIVGVQTHVAPDSRAPARWWGARDADWFRQEGHVAPRGYYLDEVRLPLERARIPPREAAEMLPQQALILDVAGRAIEQAGLSDAERLRAGVFVGVGLDLNTTNFHLRWAVLAHDPQHADAAGPPLTADRTVGALASIAASRIARAHRLGGPAFTVSSLETSGLTALNLAAQALRAGEIDVAVVGAVDFAGDVRAVLSRQPELPPADAAVALVLRRAEDAELALALLDELKEPAQATCDAGAATGLLRLARAVSAPPGKVALVYPGFGNDFPGMGRGLARRWPNLAEGRLYDAASVRDRLVAQVELATFVTDVLVEQLGIRPDAAIGYSLGESSALFALRAWRDRDGMLARLRESPLFVSDLTGRCDAARRHWGLRDGEEVDWHTGVVERSPAEVRAALDGLERAYLQIVNTPRECVVGGRRGDVEGLARRLGCPLLPVPETTTMHCPAVRPVAEAYRDLHRLPTTPPEGVRFYSAGVGGAYEVETESAADAILAQALGTLDFPAVVEAAYRDGVRVFVEVGPGASCSRMIDAILGDRPHLARSVCVAGRDEVESLRRLAAEEVPINVEGLSEAEGGNKRGKDHSITVQVGGAPFAISAGRETASKKSDAGRAVVISALPAPSALVAVAEARGEAHAAFLRLDDAVRRTFAAAVAFQSSLVERILNGAALGTESAKRQARGAWLDRDQCLQFAIGTIGDVLGPDFAEIDRFPTRVRLPDEPLMLVDRILTVEGEPLSLTHGRVVTEHDVLPGAWYLDAGRIPTCLAIEAGQADLFLSGYLGIDLRTRGLAVYRLLDAAVTFHRGLPGPGETIRYDIRIDRFFRQGDTHLFRFRFEGSVAGEPLLTMTDGCAGFFSEEELASGKGVVLTELQRRPRPGVTPSGEDDLPPVGVESYDEPQLDALRRGDLAGCFGPRFAKPPLRQPLRLPGGRMRLVHRVPHLDPKGGRFGVGLIRGEADIRPGDWFLRCHFIDDQVMPGTLMYESCLHTLRVFLMRLGWVGEDGEVACEPVPGVASRLRCRGQVTAATRTVTYEVTLKERGYRPEPYAVGDALMYADGKSIVEITDLCLRMTGLTREKVVACWAGAAKRQARPTIFDRYHVLTFATGKPSEAFGDRYRAFDGGRFLARLPAPPYSFLDRVVALDAEPTMRAGGGVTAEYDVPPEEWYFAAERGPVMPFSVLLEVVLQVCGWTAAYMGSALTSDEDLHFRNLGGQATLLRPATPDSGTLTSRVRVLRVSRSAGMIIQEFEFALEDARGSLYRGVTTFGFFTKQALAQQVGVRDARLYQPSAGELRGARAFDDPRQPPFPDNQLRMIDRIDVFLPDGGPHGLGFVEGTKAVRADEWFFAAHFFQDPVMPGSLGLEAFLQLLKVVAVERWRPGPGAHFEANLGEHRWTYRGQVVPSNQQVRVQAAVTARDDARRQLTADGFLSVDGLVIYRMIGFTLRLVGP
jgi:3-hydroxymyristoyl/3-hydroxydecanoyl-(acyl carrier protein) dehydratase/malonyl CoA-acyl carrier protein transacylase